MQDYAPEDALDVTAQAFGARAPIAKGQHPNQGAPLAGVTDMFPDGAGRTAAAFAGARDQAALAAALPRYGIAGHQVVVLGEVNDMSTEG